MVFKSRLHLLVAEQALKRNRHLGDKEIAHETGIDIRTVRKWLNGEAMRSLDPDTTDAFKTFLRCTIDDLVDIVRAE